MATITLNIYTYFLQDGYYYFDLKNLVTQFMKKIKMLAVRQKSFFWGKFRQLASKAHSPRNYLQSFYLAAVIHKCGGGIYIHLQSIEILVHAKGQDHLRMKVITMEIFC